ncbi:hypothetical protein [Nocardia miyunensis]|uniref:hypothetical protein n=1 Tax=Nocardia miyunensis TaxID=282684 RepID=UPI00082BA83B|nr:hypothetical protein [Nocardia miyunensis]
MNIDAGALAGFAKALTDEAAAIGKLNPGLGDALTALPGTDWQSTCQSAKTSVDNALQRISDRVTTLADSVDHAGKVITMTDDQFAADLDKVGMHA